MAIGIMAQFRAITELSKKKGSAYVSEIAYDELVQQVRQHEEAIAQLLEIVAVTNRRLSELDRKQKEHYSFT
ncbi:hypothetical protein [Lentibacillus salinarum]|uniref:Uncharacterized protein n=1 Tax=Lentibacillus salinarum TaxID=446820 RepID=A0ABW3ZTL7_9BACI